MFLLPLQRPVIYSRNQRYSQVSLRLFWIWLEMFESYGENPEMEVDKNEARERGGGGRGGGGERG